MERYKKFFKESLSKDQIKSFIEEIKEIMIVWSEGSGKADGKKFKSLSDAISFFEREPKPDMGYNKYKMLITFKDGAQLSSFRFDLGLKDPSFEKQLFSYLEHNVSIEED